MRLGKTIILKQGGKTLYRLIESEGDHGKKSYTVMVTTEDEISYLEDISCDRCFSEEVISALCENGVAPVTLYDVLEEVI